MAKKIKNENAEAVVEAVSKTERFLNKNIKLLAGIAGAIMLSLVGFYLWFAYYYQPLAEEAKGQMAYAEQYFCLGDFNRAMNGDDNYPGFAEIIEDYGHKAPNSAYLYAGICELQLNNWESAISYLKEYDGDDDILAARALACIGDAYVALENYEEALNYFEEASTVIDNVYAADYLLKAGAVAEKLGQNEKALEFYNIIKEQYPMSPVGYEIDKYIGRLQ